MTCLHSGNERGVGANFRVDCGVVGGLGVDEAGGVRVEA